MGQVKINGIRLNRQYTLLSQENIDREGSCVHLLYQTLEKKRINMVAMAFSTMANRPFVSAVVDSKHAVQMVHGKDRWSHYPDVCTVSIYPHHYSLYFLGFLMQVLGQQNVVFQHMISSNAMLTFVAEKLQCDALMENFSTRFDLPQSHTPFEQGENEELTQFLKIKYPEIRATYVEERIKTYGMTLTSDLNFSIHDFSFDQLAKAGQKILLAKDKENTFFYTSARMESVDQINFFLLTKKPLDIPARQTGVAELLSFQGPHFGDRHSIISRAMNCLAKNVIPVLLVGCTGAHIAIVLPQGKGRMAKQALTAVFESP